MRHYRATEQETRLYCPPPDNRVCVCGKPIGEHEWTADWRLVADGCDGFKESAQSKVINGPDEYSPQGGRR